MDIPHTTEPMAYIIYRDIPEGEPFDPTSPLVFFPPKGSDELFDALRLAFPHLKTHSERMRDAIIQYLLEERQEEQSCQNPSPTTTMNTMPTNWPSMASDTPSLLSSPDLDFGTPVTSFANSPQPQATRSIRQTSSTTSAEASPPTLDMMTGVFSVSTSNQPKQRIRRKMTEAEKVDYRKRRIVKACDKCAKRKRKCPHNQAEMASIPVAASTSTSRISKKISPTSSKSLTPPNEEHVTFVDASAMLNDDMAFLNNLDPVTMAPIEDFNMFDDTFSELDMNSFGFENLVTSANLFTPAVSPGSLDWLNDPYEHFELQDTATEVVQARHHQQVPHANANVNGPSGPDSISRFALGVDVLQYARSSTSLDSSASSDAQSSWEGYGLENSTLADGEQHHVGGGDGMLWEHLRTGQIEKPVPTHTAHVHESESTGLSGLDDNATGPSGYIGSSSSLPRLLDTKKALKSQFRLPSSSVTLAQAINAVSSARAPAHGATRPVGNERSCTRASSSASPECREGAFASLDEKARGAKSIGAPQVMLKSSRSAGRSAVRSGSLQPRSHSRTSTMLAEALFQAPGPDTGFAQRPQHQRCILSPTLGEGIPETADPTVQLYMTRRRTSLTINTFCGANMNAGLPGSGTAGGAQLQTISKPVRSAEAARFAASSDKTLLSSANGGAYLRPEGGAVCEPRLLDGDVQEGPASLANADNITTSTFVAFGAAEQTRPSHPMLTRSQTRAAATQEPLLSHGSETKRYRDHHGRTSSLTAYSVMCFLLLASICWLAGCEGILAPQILLLSLVHIQDAKPVQCTGKNSSWLSTYASRQVGSLGRGEKKAKSHSWSPNWLQGSVGLRKLSLVRGVLV